MNNSFILSLLACCLFATTPLVAQEDLREQGDYLEAQGEVYQRWLESTGLGQALRVNDVRVGEDYVSIRLLVPFEEAEMAMSAYQALKDTFEAQSVLTLEEHLFYKALVILDVPQEMVNVSIRNSYTKRLPFLRSIGFRDGEMKVKEDSPKAKITDILLGVRPMEGEARPGVADFGAGYEKEEVFDCILSYVEERYLRRECFDKKPELTVLEKGNRLRFKIKGLCREVIPEDNSLVGSILSRLGLGKNWYKRELLVFVISYVPTENGAQLVIILEGKFGSGLYASVNERGYILMETDFNQELEDYTDAFGVSLKEVLENCRP